LQRASLRAPDAPPRKGLAARAPGRRPRLDRAVVRAALEPHDLQEHLRAAAPGRAGAAVARARGRHLGLQHGRRGPVRAQLRRDVHQLALPPAKFFNTYAILPNLEKEYVG
jgi:hypothetical protein